MMERTWAFTIHKVRCWLISVRMLKGLRMFFPQSALVCVNNHSRLSASGGDGTGRTVVLTPLRFKCHQIAVQRLAGVKFDGTDASKPTKRKHRVRHHHMGICGMLPPQPPQRSDFVSPGRVHGGSAVLGTAHMEPPAVQLDLMPLQADQ